MSHADRLDDATHDGAFMTDTSDPRRNAELAAAHLATIVDEIERAVVGKRAAIELLVAGFVVDTCCSTTCPVWPRR
jgi:hypothetical protein